MTSSTLHPRLMAAVLLAAGLLLVGSAVLHRSGPWPGISDPDSPSTQIQPRRLVTIVGAWLAGQRAAPLLGARDHRPQTVPFVDRAVASLSTVVLMAAVSAATTHVLWLTSLGLCWIRPLRGPPAGVKVWTARSADLPD